MSALDVPTQHQLAAAAFNRLVHDIEDGQWCEPTPCAAWNVRQLVNHVVYENRWSVPLLAGKTVADLGDTFHGDLLGADPVAAWRESAAEAATALDAPDAMTRTVHLSFGDVTGEEYGHQLVADLLIHGWDLARAIGADESLDPTLVDHVADWFADWEDGYRAAGAIGLSRDSGRRGTCSRAPRRLRPPRRHRRRAERDPPIQRSLRPTRRRCRDGNDDRRLRVRGRVAARPPPPRPGGSPRSVGAALRQPSPLYHRGGRRVWRPSDLPTALRLGRGSVRGIDLFRVADGKVAEKLAYVKG